jgi:acyl-CoA thioesterase I
MTRPGVSPCRRGLGRAWTPLLVMVGLLVGLAACESSDDARPAASASPRTASTSPNPAPTPLERPRIVALGDSLTAGLGLDAADAWPALVQRRLDDAGYRYEVINAGVSGDTTAGGLRRLDWSLEGEVEVLVLELGANDGLRGLPVDEIRRNLDAIVTEAQSRGIKVLLCGMEAPPNFGRQYADEFRQVFKDVADAHDVAFLPFFLEGVAGEAALNQPDGIHPNVEGTRRVADIVWQALEPLLERSDDTT